ncbi:hypothetical protein CEXT_557041, partial [Caerostris extrusa]
VTAKRYQIFYDLMASSGVNVPFPKFHLRQSNHLEAIFT